LESALLLAAKFGDRERLKQALRRAVEAARRAPSDGLRRAARTALGTFGKALPALLTRRRLPQQDPRFFNGDDYEWRRPFDFEAAELLAREPDWKAAGARAGDAPVSIVIEAASGDPALIERALRSVLFQTHRAVEAVIIENG